MKKGPLFVSSILMGLIGLLLPSCRAKKQVPSEPSVPGPEPRREIVEPSEMRLLYGIPPEVYERKHANDSIAQDSSRVTEAPQAQ